MEVHDSTAEEPQENPKLSDLPLHSVFIDLSLENDLKGSELEWFKSRICLEKISKKRKKEEKAIAERRKINIVAYGDAEIPTENSNKLFIKLKETQTMWLFTLDTLYSQNNLADAERVRKDNETYQMKKTKKELIRKRCMADAQTPRYMEKSRGTETEEIKMADAVVFASEWDLYDTYNSFDESQLKSSGKYLKSIEMVKCEITENSTTQVEPTEDVSGTEEENRFLQTLDTSNFKYAMLVTERLLASNSYQREQSAYKRKFMSPYDETPTKFSYDLKPLWNYKKDFQDPLMVTDIDWNPLDQDLLAVGYGSLDFLKVSAVGLVCIWSPKNPRQPEREFLFEESVTCVSHSKTRPNLLAVGTRGGRIYLADVSSQDGRARQLKSDDSKPRPHPIWKVQWYQHKELIFEKEHLLAVGESGVLMLFSFSSDDFPTDMLKLDYVVSSEKFLEKKVSGRTVQWLRMDEDLSYDKKTFSGLSFSIFSDRNFCYVSTKEGVLVKCNMRNPSMTTGIFLAHDGPVYVVAHSPVTDLIYLTCGADWTIRIWMEGITKPLLSLQNNGPVRCARWSPTIPTILAAICDTELSIWDISRNILFPVSRRNFHEETGQTFSTVLFSTNGMNLIIGGEDGLVRIVEFSELPRIPFLQKEALIAAIRNGLYRNKAMIEPFQRAVELHKEQLKTEVVV